MRRKNARGVHANAQRAWHALIDHYGEDAGYSLCVQLWMRAEELRRMNGPAAPHYAALLDKLSNDLERVLQARGYIDDATA